MESYLTLDLCLIASPLDPLAAFPDRQESTFSALHFFKCLGASGASPQTPPGGPSAPRGPPCSYCSHLQQLMLFAPPPSTGQLAPPPSLDHRSAKLLVAHPPPSSTVCREAAGC